ERGQERDALPALDFARGVEQILDAAPEQEERRDGESRDEQRVIPAGNPDSHATGWCNRMASRMARRCTQLRMRGGRSRTACGHRRPQTRAPDTRYRRR